MKKLSLFLFLLLGILKVSACSCAKGTLAENYLEANVVGVIKILKVYDENPDQRTYKADVEFEKIYKGTKFTTLNVRGLIGKSSSAACERDIIPNQRFLVLLNGSNNSFTVSHCSAMSSLNVQPTKDEEAQLEKLSKAFSYLEKNKLKFKGAQFSYYYDEKQGDNPKSELSRINNFNPKQPFAIYKVKLDDSFKIKEMSPIIGFGSKDKIIEGIMKRNIRVETPMFRDTSKKKEYLILLFYNKQNINIPNREVISDSW
ncbi:hypothetical protein [Chryseobacterium jejuense]|uniref:Tissue inhibitor of metalloproteinase n=1 Tax=Chryseobacterium jejuense TaxID=445960 RepID=A0A2X2X3Y0_CHRJE|nr:hypothetical protein [Chryseobacterium jejuense]SDJ33173.1 hypothetical protein SAMN05421542_3209 [Chryseobacterium jejuense]SQB45321.1 Uncharacterised protein [Chryseobacterium jejuense]